jgi:pyruvate/2-oxoglutarate dehydrogenase complex dihydrolipoamide dehydrogenase (E3) component
MIETHAPGGNKSSDSNESSEKQKLTHQGSDAHYDLIVIGSGQCGNPLAAAFFAAGQRVAVIERGDVGGTCVNVGCSPTKTLVASAEVAYMARRAADFGVHTGPIKFDMRAAIERKRGIVKASRTSSERKYEQGIDLLRGTGFFTGPRQVRVKLNNRGYRDLTAELIVIDTGLSPAVPKLQGINSVPYLDNASIMELEELPQQLLVRGGGYIGLEFAQMFRRFGSEVTVIQSGPKLLDHEDDDVAEAVADLLREDGIEILLGAHATAVSKAGDEIQLEVTTIHGATTLRGSHLLVATGRTPNTSELKLEAAGIAVDEHGYVKVDERLGTSAPGVYAVGDVNGGPAFTHISYDDYRVLKANLLDGGNRVTTGRPVPYCVFIDPQLARIGLSESGARQVGRKYQVAKVKMSSVARAYETGQTRGFMKALVDPETKEILGAAILGAEGGELMSMIEIAMMGKLPYTALKDAIFAHPTFAESLNILFAKLDAKQA